MIFFSDSKAHKFTNRSHKSYDKIYGYKIHTGVLLYVDYNSENNKILYSALGLQVYLLLYMLHYV